MKKLWKIISNRMFIVAIIFIFQFALLLASLLYFRTEFVYWYALEIICSVVFIVVIVNMEANAAYRIGWLIPLCIFPIFGAIAYLMFRPSRIVQKAQMRMDLITKNFRLNIQRADDKLEELEGNAYLQSRYLEDNANAPIFRDYDSRFYSSGEAFFVDFLDDLRSAKEYIFLEFFIIAEGKMLDDTLHILKQKVEEGVEVRVLYDDIGSISTLPRKFYATLKEYGIEVHVFNPIRFIAMPKHNNRDHRKIMVIDGKIAYTGGLNLADEYINVIERFGYWKDTAVRIQGPAVTSFVTMFLSMWNFFEKEKLLHETYFRSYDTDKEIGRGYIQPYNDSPLDTEPIGETVYIHMINRAKKYFYVTTPYLVLSDEMVNALCIAAKSGIDVRIVTPGIPDKKLVYIITRSYYETLLEAGVRIYEFSPGFVHAKQSVSDDLYATVGTINMDFRSLYLHFECGVWYYQSPIVEKVKEDMLDLFSKSDEIMLGQLTSLSKAYRLMMGVLRIFAPLV